MSPLGSSTVLGLVILFTAVSTTLSQDKKEDRYIFYDVNPGEGFNLRRDVFMRVAVMVKNLNVASKLYKYTLVLPPWGRLYHWQSRDLSEPQIRIPWSHFFDLESIRRFVPVIDLVDYPHLAPGDGITKLDRVFYLQGYKEGWGDHYEEKFDFRECLNENMRNSYRQDGGSLWQGWFWGYHDVIRARDFECLSVQGGASVIIPLIEETSGSSTSIVLDRAENLLHDSFGDENYWGIRRSMRFAPKLVRIGDKFRKENLDSEDVKDDTVLAVKWEDHKPARKEGRGGPYACVHLRRKDFVHSRNDQIPSLKGAAQQLVKKLHTHNLKKLYVATDAPETEYNELKRHLADLDEGVEVHRYAPPSQAIKDELKDGGVAIVDQIICSHARYFVGSYESTFSFRIQEEREIMGFPVATTFDMMCADGKGDNCEKGSKWKIVYPQEGSSPDREEL